MTPTATNQEPGNPKQNNIENLASHRRKPLAQAKAIDSKTKAQLSPVAEVSQEAEWQKSKPHQLWPETNIAGDQVMQSVLGLKPLKAGWKDTLFGKTKSTLKS